MKTLTLSVADRIVDKAMEKGKELKLAPLTVIVLDAGGHTVVLKREDGSSLLRPEIAMGKAWGTLGMGFGGRDLARRAAKVRRRSERHDGPREGSAPVGLRRPRLPLDRLPRL